MTKIIRENRSRASEKRECSKDGELRAIFRGCNKKNRLHPCGNGILSKVRVVRVRCRFVSGHNCERKRNRHKFDTFLRQCSNGECTRRGFSDEGPCRPWSARLARDTFRLPISHFTPSSHPHISIKICALHATICTPLLIDSICARKYSFAVRISRSQIPSLWFTYVCVPPACVFQRITYTCLCLNSAQCTTWSHETD